MNLLRRTIHPEVRVIDEKAGTVEYIASDETLDSYNEVIKASGWKFDDFQRNSPFVDSHDYSTIGNCLGKVLDFAVRKKQLVETVQWAIGLEPMNELAELGFAMTKAGFLKAVSVGFQPLEYVTPYGDKQAWADACESIGHDPAKTECRTIYLAQQQKELSACLVGANPAAVAKAFKAEAISEKQLAFLAAKIGEASTARQSRETAGSTVAPADVEPARQRARTAFLVELHTQLNRL
jgi:hypothetical protein